MFKKITVAVCMGLLLNLLLCSTAFAMNNSEEKITKVRKDILSLGMGTDAEIKLKLYDKTKIKGYISKSNNESFTVIDKNTNQSIKVEYPQIKKASGKNNLTGRWIAVGFVVLALIGIITVAAVSSDH